MGLRPTLRAGLRLRRLCGPRIGAGCLIDLPSDLSARLFSHYNKIGRARRLALRTSPLTQSSTKLSWGNPDYLPKACGERRRCLIADAECYLSYRQQLIGQKPFRPRNTKIGQPHMRCLPGRLAKGSAEMKPTQVDECGKLVEADPLLEHVVHVRGDARHLPIR